VGASLKFYVLQDAHGRVQLVIKPSENPNTPTPGLDDVPLQSVVMVQGTVGLRRGSSIRRDVSTISLGKVLN
jgi:aspartyl-tRNA synthetase